MCVQVHSLEVANRKLEMQIREFCEQKTTISRDLSSYYVNITDLQTKAGLTQYMSLHTSRSCLEADGSSNDP